MAVPRGATRPGSFLLAAFAAATLFPLRCECRCRGCNAFASYYITQNQTLTNIANLFGISFQDIESTILPPNNLTNKDIIPTGARVKIPFSCVCIDGDSLGQTFAYRTVVGDTYLKIAQDTYHNLTTESSLLSVNSYEESRIPDGVDINVTVPCFCGDADVSRDYGLFLTYPLRSGETPASVANATGFADLGLLRQYNPTANFSEGHIIYVPTAGEARKFLKFSCFDGSNWSIGRLSSSGLVYIIYIGTFICIWVIWK